MPRYKFSASKQTNIKPEKQVCRLSSHNCRCFIFSEIRRLLLFTAAFLYSGFTKSDQAANFGLLLHNIFSLPRQNGRQPPPPPQL